jgi:hypothetical protein
MRTLDKGPALTIVFAICAILWLWIWWTAVALVGIF